MHEAKIEQGEHGKYAADDGWFILNLRDVPWGAVEGGGTWSELDSPNAPWTALGFGLHVLGEGESSGKYHAEDDQEGFLLLSGKAVIAVEGQERHMTQWDYFHCPKRTAHAIIGGEGGATFAMIGTRTKGRWLRYFPDEVAAKYGKSVAEETGDSKVAYSDRGPFSGRTAPDLPSFG